MNKTEKRGLAGPCNCRFAQKVFVRMARWARGVMGFSLKAALGEGALACKGWV
jgi:hypothetical protein